MELKEFSCRDTNLCQRQSTTKKKEIIGKKVNKNWIENEREKKEYLFWEQIKSVQFQVVLLERFVRLIFSHMYHKLHHKFKLVLKFVSSSSRYVLYFKYFFENFLFYYFIWSSFIALDDNFFFFHKSHTLIDFIWWSFDLGPISVILLII